MFARNFNWPYLALMTMHGTIMVFFVLTTAPQGGFGNYFLPYPREGSFYDAYKGKERILSIADYYDSLVQSAIVKKIYPALINSLGIEKYCHFAYRSSSNKDVPNEYTRFNRNLIVIFGHLQ